MPCKPLVYTLPSLLAALKQGLQISLMPTLLHPESHRLALCICHADMQSTICDSLTGVTALLAPLCEASCQKQFILLFWHLFLTTQILPSAPCSCASWTRGWT